MSKDAGSETIDSVAGNQQQMQVQVQVEDTGAPTVYASLFTISGTAEEISIDCSRGLRPTGPKTAVLKIDQRLVMSPWAAKRLAIQLGQAVQRYEATYGELELDERKRRVGGQA